MLPNRFLVDGDFHPGNGARDCHVRGKHILWQSKKELLKESALHQAVGRIDVMDSVPIQRPDAQAREGTD